MELVAHKLRLEMVNQQLMMVTSAGIRTGAEMAIQVSELTDQVVSSCCTVAHLLWIARIDRHG